MQSTYNPVSVQRAKIQFENFCSEALFKMTKKKSLLLIFLGSEYVKSEFLSSYMNLTIGASLQVSSKVFFHLMPPAIESSCIIRKGLNKSRHCYPLESSSLRKAGLLDVPAITITFSPGESTALILVSHWESCPLRYSGGTSSKVLLILYELPLIS